MVGLIRTSGGDLGLSRTLLARAGPCRGAARHTAHFQTLATFVAETNNRHPALVPLPPVPTFMGRGTARRPVEPPAPAPSYGAMVGNQGAPEPRPVDEDADGGVFADY